MKDKKLAVIFDMDGVLVDSEHAMMATSIESLSRFGINPCCDDFLEFTGMGEDMFIGGVARKYGLQYSTDMKDYAYKLYVEKAQDLVLVFPNVKNVLLNLKDRGFKIAVASAADLIKVESNLNCIGVDVSFFDAVVSGSEVKNKKPDPEIFLKAAEKIGVLQEYCIVIEDALSGIKAAKAAGMASVGITTSFDAETLSSVGPDYVVHSINEVLDVIQKLGGQAPSAPMGD
jgi:HAD superfamily hydrolase (TIGR01509 family)